MDEPSNISRPRGLASEVVVLRGTPVTFAVSIERVARRVKNDVLVFNMSKSVAICLFLEMRIVLYYVRDAYGDAEVVKPLPLVDEMMFLIDFVQIDFVVKKEYLSLRIPTPL